jgi:putative hydrolase of the HAD superfamily
VNIVFDLGGVVVRWEPETIVAHAFSDPDVAAKARREIIGHADWLELDRGTLSLKDATARAARRTGLAKTVVAKFLRNVPRELVPIPETVEILYALKARGHQLYCLSNMHVASIEHLERSYSFWDLFTGKVISCRLHLCKPEPAIYDYLLKTYALDRDSTVFIDDVHANLHAAVKFGMQTIHFKSPGQCQHELQSLGCLEDEVAELSSGGE